MTLNSAHILTVENAHSLHTEKKQIEFKAKTDIRYKAGNNIFLNSSTENVEMKAGKDMVIDVEDNLSLEVRNKDLNIVVKSGNFEIKAAKAITVKGQGGGNISVSQAGGSVVIDTGGADAGKDISKLNLAALDVFNHVARKAQDIAATINSTTAKEKIAGEDATVDQVQANAGSNAATTKNTTVLPAANDEKKETHFLELEYKDQNGDGVNDVQFVVNFDDGSKVESTMHGGFHRLEGVPDKGFTVEFVPSEKVEQELKVLRKELRSALDQSLQQVRSETAMLQKTWEQTALWQKPFIYVGGALTGAGQWIADTAEGMVDLVSGTVKTMVVTDVWLAEYTGHRAKAFKYFADGNDEGFKQEMQQITAMHKQVGENINDAEAAIRNLALIALDSETRTMIQEFPMDYFGELHSTEKVRTGFRYGIDFALILAAGAGAGLLAIKNAGRISKILAKIAKALEKLRLNLKARKAKVDKTYTFKAKGSTTSNYEIYPGIDKPKVGDRIHKRIHKDRNTSDPYTLQADGKPLGASEGELPRKMKGMKKLPPNHDAKVKEGWPNLNKIDSKGRQRKDFANFIDAKPEKLEEGTTIYRIVDEKAGNAGGYWSRELPQNKTAWRKDYAVKDVWNDNGYYVEHKVGPGGLKVWEGKTAGQPYEQAAGKDFYLEGGKKQIYVEPGSITTSEPKLTNWPEP